MTSTREVSVTTFTGWLVLLVLAAAPATADYVVSQEAGNGGGNAPSYGQSFTTLESGVLTQIDFGVDYRNQCASGTLKLYSGNRSWRDGAPPIYQQSFSGFPTSWSSPPFWQWGTVVLTTPVAVDASSQYSFEVGCSQLYLRFSPTDVYAGGQKFTDGNAVVDQDLIFRAYVKTEELIAQEDPTNVVSGAVTQGQSFTPEWSGNLTQIDIDLSGVENECTSVELRFYWGTASWRTASAAFTHTFTVPDDGWASLVLTTPVSVGSGLHYSFEIAPVSSCVLALHNNTSNPYAGGYRWGDGNPVYSDDLVFRAHVEDLEAPVPVELQTFRVE